jgi:hypothetical protein
VTGVVNEKAKRSALHPCKKTGESEDSIAAGAWNKTGRRISTKMSRLDLFGPDQKTKKLKKSIVWMISSKD